MKAKKTVIAITFGMLLTMAVLGAMSFVNYSKGTKEFIADGYILKPSEEVNVTTQVNEQYYFSQGEKYREKFETKVLFKDTSNQEVSIDTDAAFRCHRMFRACRHTDRRSSTDEDRRPAASLLPALCSIRRHPAAGAEACSCRRCLQSPFLRA